MIIFNFAHPLSACAINQLSQEYGSDVEHVKVNVQLEIFKSDDAPIEDQMLNIILPYAKEFDGSQRIIIISPGMSNATLVLVTIIHALSGRFPEVVELRLNSNKVFGYHRTIDLAALRAKIRLERY